MDLQVADNGQSYQNSHRTTDSFVYKINEAGANDMILKGQSSVQNLPNLPMIIKPGDDTQAKT